MIQSKRWTHLAWLFPLMATVLVGSLLYFANHSRQQRNDSDMARLLIRQRIDASFTPLKLTAMHFASISPGIPLPEETILRHFRFLQNLGDFTSLALVTADQRVLAQLGEQAPLLVETTRQRTDGVPFLLPSTKAGELDALLFGAPLPDSQPPQWIVARMPLSRLTNNLPVFVHLRVSPQRDTLPVHPLFPHLTTQVAVYNRPVWPLILGEFMLFCGIVLLVFLSNRLSNNSRPQQAQEKK